MPGTGGGYPERKRHERVARGKGPVRSIAREWICPCLFPQRKMTPDKKSKLEKTSIDGAE